MLPDSENPKSPIGNRIVVYVGIVMAIIYFAFGMGLAVFQKPLFNLTLKNQRILGAVLILYSLFRGYMLYTRYFKRSKYVEKDIP